MEAKQMSAVFGSLALLGTLAALGFATITLVAAKVIGEERLASCFTFGARWLFGGRGLARKISIATVVGVILYSTTLFATSIASREWTLAPGVEKYFCEIDCHLAYSVSAAESAKSVGSESAPVHAKGRFLIVSVRTRFDESTISRHRGDFPLCPTEREISIVDDAGRSYAIAETAQEALNAQGLSGVPLTQPLRPGESYDSKFVFDLPIDAHHPRLMVRSTKRPRWIATIVIGDEDSILHKKVFLALPSIERP